ncbi:hypothetical protein FKW77_003122 [Venturia effusa]|uniref:Peptidase A1 domain-containing protein n=1 Tax=Venturia effusa TaxID=50376 RepID=A0A517LGT5_9PEZI|nr:hypothetical protein FKW77_003122 [Venturia effusa]
MDTYTRVWTISTLLVTAFTASLTNRRIGATLSLHQLPINTTDPSIASTIRAPYLKFGLPVPAELEDAIVRDVAPGQTSVSTKPVNYDQAYVTSVQIGNQTLLMDIDTGSSDFCSTQMINPETLVVVSKAKKCWTVNSFHKQQGFKLESKTRKRSDEALSISTLSTPSFTIHHPVPGSPKYRWVISTLLQPPRANQPQSRTYDPSTSKAQRMDGYSWSMSYGDGSTAGGPVFLDTVKIGTLTVPNQAVEVAKTISQKFRTETIQDGLMGLGSTGRNNVRPQKQKTWFDNILPQLASPVFTVSLKRRTPGTFDFGFIDPAKYTGDIVYAPVLNGPRSKGYWDFQPSGFAIGTGPIHTASFPAIVDTGSSQCYVPATIAAAYWEAVPGSSQKSGYGWTFPCETPLPDLTIAVSGGRVVVKGVNMNYKTIRTGLCWGGLQADIMGFSIFGDVFMKGLFVVHEVGEGGRAKRIGFAQQRA